jgi:hypothetical protein
MAYIGQEEKKELAPAIKAVFKKYDVKGSIGIHHHSELVVNISKGKLDLIGDEEAGRKKQAAQRGHDFYPISNNHYQVNQFYAAETAVNPKIGKFFEELITAMKGNRWFDKSDSQSDYFHTAYYMSINVGKWNKEYELV